MGHKSPKLVLAKISNKCPLSKVEVVRDYLRMGAYLIIFPIGQVVVE